MRKQIVLKNYNNLCMNCDGYPSNILNLLVLSITDLLKAYLHSFQIVEIKARNLKLVFIFQF